MVVRYLVVGAGHRVGERPLQQVDELTLEAAEVVIGDPLRLMRIAGRRRFFSAALVYAFLLKDLDHNDLRCLGRILTADPDDPLPELVASAIIHARHDGRPVRLDTLLARVTKDRDLRARDAQGTP